MGYDLSHWRFPVVIRCRPRHLSEICAFHIFSNACNRFFRNTWLLSVCIRVRLSNILVRPHSIVSTNSMAGRIVPDSRLRGNDESRKTPHFSASFPRKRESSNENSSIDRTRMSVWWVCISLPIVAHASQGCDFSPHRGRLAGMDAAAIGGADASL